MNVLVTGAGGFVGGHVVAALAAAGHDVRALVRPGRPAPPASERIGVVRGDVTSANDADAAAAGCDAVVHVAGLIKAHDEAGFARVNVFGARVMAEAALRQGVRRFVLVSSLAARGPAGAGRPVSIYGRSKLGGEVAVRAAAGERMEVVILRPTAVYGPGDEALLPLFRLARRGLRPLLAGAGPLTFVHAHDLAAGIAGMLTAPAATVSAGVPFEVASPGSHSWPEVSRWLAEAVGREGLAFRVPPAVVRAAGLGADLIARLSGAPQVFGTDKVADAMGDWSANAEAFWRAAGTSPKVALREGLAATAAAYAAAGRL